jgi:hypothetical protein
MDTIINESQTTTLILKLLKAAGWSEYTILKEPALRLEGRTVRPDFVLQYNLYPIAQIEIFSPSPEEPDPDPAVLRSLKYAEIFNTNFTFISDGVRIWSIKNGGEFEQLQNFPSPQELTATLKTEWGENDPRLYPQTQAIETLVNIEQVIATTRTIEAYLTGEKYLTLNIADQNSKNQIANYIALKLIGTGRQKRLLYLSAFEVKALQVRQQLQKLLPQTEILYVQNLINQEKAEAVITIAPYNRGLGYSLKRNSQLPNDAYDLIIVVDSPESELPSQLADYFPEAKLIMITSTADQKASFGKLVFGYGVEDQIALETLRPPEGYNSALLKEISEIRAGKSVFNENGEHQAKIITGRDINSDGSVDFSKLGRINLEQGQLERHRLQPGDILVATWVPIENAVKITMIPEGIDSPLVFVNRLNRIRVDTQRLNPNQVYEFLRSDSGQRLLRQFAEKTRIRVVDLSQVPIFFRNQATVADTVTPSENISQDDPTELNPVQPQPIAFTEAARAKQEVLADILTLLDQVINDETNGLQNQATSNLQIVATRLQKMANRLGRKSLTDRVLERYPTPIALTYRRFLEARFNPFEQVSRLRDVYEAASFFVYNVVLADRCRNLNAQNYPVTAGNEKGAYKNSALAGRLFFVEKICNLSVARGEKLFLSQLPDSDFVSNANKLRELRNKLSHTVTLTESQIKNILEENRPLLEQLLESLSFLANYRFVRIPAFYYEDGKLVRQLEIYSGTAPFPEVDTDFEEELSQLKIHRGHLVLLDEDDNALDLNPLYQLIAHKDTGFVTHLCYLKAVLSNNTQIQAESVQEGKELITTQGLIELMNLTKSL